MKKMKENNSNSPAQGVVSDDDVVFVTIFRKDRDWVNGYKMPGETREMCLHRILEDYRGDRVM